VFSRYRSRDLAHRKADRIGFGVAVHAKQSIDLFIRKIQRRVSVFRKTIKFGVQI
jgi:hypothetical protein